ncbi:hypothetical protein IFM89_037853 [Coptis chinensis]|uniref:RNA polymerase subunit H/Rpb5 C-terminal domain-containing protein n=1 Tax=Coptis chinensis TaxID=261450 RepID=A0A835HSS3_9MAGN|nr:hypothetical protein IFM89_037853 [Coptis chinensis]
MKACFARMSSENVFRAILVSQKALTPPANQAVKEMSSKFHLEAFVDEELLVNINYHCLVPKHNVLSTKEKKALLHKYSLKETQSSGMCKTILGNAIQTACSPAKVALYSEGERPRSEIVPNLIWLYKEQRPFFNRERGSVVFCNPEGMSVLTHNAENGFSLSESVRSSVEIKGGISVFLFFFCFVRLSRLDSDESLVM